MTKSVYLSLIFIFYFFRDDDIDVDPLAQGAAVDSDDDVSKPVAKKGKKARKKKDDWYVNIRFLFLQNNSLEIRLALSATNEDNDHLAITHRSMLP